MEKDTIHAGCYKPDIVLGYGRIGFYINRKPIKYSFPSKEKVNYGDFDKHLTHGSMKNIKKIVVDVSDIRVEVPLNEI